MKRVEIKALFAEPERYTAEPVTICGWVRTLRSSKALGFIELNDGSYLSYRPPAADPRGQAAL